MTKKEQEQREEIMDIFIRSLTANIEEIDGNPEAYLRTAMDKVIKSYGMKITKKSKSKLFYYIRRDLIGYGQMDVLMNDATLRIFRLMEQVFQFSPIIENSNRSRQHVFGIPMKNSNPMLSNSHNVVENTSPLQIRYLTLP